jgi:prepilin-type N-terminal cleavage/methylation domain-containing protein
MTMRSARGFSLLEVLAAVMILSIWYMIIANSAVLALRAEGESRRRIEAGRLAAMKLSELETVIIAGAAPELMNETEEVDNFAIKWIVAPFSLGQGGFKVKQLDETQEPKGLRRFVSYHAPSLGRNIRAITVRVRWKEGDSPRSIVRSTFAFDQQKAAELYDREGFKKADDDQDDANEDASSSSSSQGQNR